MDYTPVWQTWNLLRQTHSMTPTDPDADKVANQQQTRDVRERMQITRIRNRLTVHELARRVGCDVETLAAFERGEGVVSGEVQARICAELRM